jgi:hypothetical protein
MAAIYTEKLEKSYVKLLGGRTETNALSEGVSLFGVSIYGPLSSA